MEIVAVLLTSIRPSEQTWDEDKPDWIGEDIKITDPVIFVAPMVWKDRRGVQIYFSKGTGTFWHFTNLPIRFVYKYD